PSIHLIQVSKFLPFGVLCDSETAGSGWTIIQQRINGKEDFYRDWASYRDGFGSFEGDFFLGLEKIHRLTTDQPHKLYIHMEFFNGKIQHALYDKFAIAGEDDGFELISLSEISDGVQEDQLAYHVNEKFSTFDRDNDSWKNGSCAESFKGGWWYSDCARR
ncbi:hypothetical protein KR222_010055, partial [Zaprionus bogoriensis]